MTKSFSIRDLGWEEVKIVEFVSGHVADDGVAWIALSELD